MNKLVQMKKSAGLLCVFSIASLYAMEHTFVVSGIPLNGEDTKYMVTITPLPISDKELSHRKEQYAKIIQWKKRLGESIGYETIYFPREAHIDIDVAALNKELGLPHTNSVHHMTGNEFWVPKGMDPRFIHKTLKPETR